MAEEVKIIDADLVSLTFKRRDDSVGFVIKGSVAAMPIREASINDPKEKQLVNEITYSLHNTLSVLIETKNMRQGKLPLGDENGKVEFGLISDVKDSKKGMPTPKKKSTKKTNKKNK